MLFVVRRDKPHGVAVVTGQAHDNGILGVVIESVALEIPVVVIPPQYVQFLFGVVEVVTDLLIDTFGIVDQVNAIAVDGKLVHIELAFFDSGLGIGIDAEPMLA